MAKEYIYAVSRIHAKEQSLLTMQDLNGLIMCPDYESCVNMLKDKGYGGENDGNNSELMLRSESEKTAELLNELLGDEKDALDIFKYKADFHNLKLAIKSAITLSEPDEYIMRGGKTEPQSIIKSVAEKKFELLPDYLRDVCEKAFSTLLETGRGQLCDIIIDKAYLEFIYKQGSFSDSKAISLYAKLTVLGGNVKTAVRCADFGKGLDFIKNALADTPVIDIKELSKAALDGIDAVCACISNTEFFELADALRVSVNEFEKQCDNTLMKELRLQKNDHFSVAPLAAYYLAKESEMKSVRLILSAKLNNLDENVIKERLRDLYV
ncbi:MAG: V-type ATPase subunit [Clostridiales bacterium]|nr:V-type ATPase subunit [Clostridiales bacterium]